MKFPVHRFKPFLINVRVDLRRCDIGVAQHILNNTQVRPVL